jgi:hypothetical protein
MRANSFQQANLLTIRSSHSNDSIRPHNLTTLGLAAIVFEPVTSRGVLEPQRCEEQIEGDFHLQQ